MVDHLSYLKEKLENEKQGISEYQLIKTIEKERPDFFDELNGSERLYQKHFLLFHYLHQLKPEFQKKNLLLSISALSIELLDETTVENGHHSITQHDGLAGFYLDKKNLFLSEAEVAVMQKVFWEKFLALEKKSEAIKTLQLTGVSPLSLSKVKKQYQKLAQKHHPDKGGCTEAFNKIKSSYQELKLLLE
ncbi:DNA-J related domain-containing protein [Pleionea sediminis]|uniref:DNA-J related domain-containing protein n=1 Tax=Pleionea sediminis TaxID=2569479 RepID=UPI0011848114|nr:DNA-J related domain-containing protein [Pleionea sediminis]